MTRSITEIVPTTPNETPTATPPARLTPTAVYEDDEHSSTTGHVASVTSVSS